MTATAVTIGNFDGVHVGHVSLVHRARQLVGHSGRVVVMSFDPHPITLLRPDHAPPRLSLFDRRAELLKAQGADEVVKLEPTRELLNKEPDEFIADLVRSHTPSVLVEGDDFHFGRARRGSPQTLRILGQAMGFDVEVVPAIEVPLGDHQIARASSSLVRWLLRHGRVRDAEIVLGRPYELAGTVVKGDQRGRTIGFPTANLATDCLLPADGVYATLAALPDGSLAPAAVNIGTRPTFSGPDRRVEAHLLGTRWNGPEYGWPLSLRFVAWLRDQVRFDSVQRLQEQLARDTDRALSFCRAETPRTAVSTT
ncbi:MAG: riboflavin biosynthesis protein RibF [Planctomycetes bacterium]|nr:riboflavin biosynthesis protein RibF [Planctomycetota bacterium]